MYLLKTKRKKITSVNWIFDFRVEIYARKSDFKEGSEFTIHGFYEMGPSFALAILSRFSHNII